MDSSAHLIRFLQQQSAQLREENKELAAEVDALRHYIRSLQRFQETVRAFTPEQDVLALLEETLDCALVLLEADDGSLLLLDEETDELVFILAYGAVRETLPGYRFDRNEGIAGWVLNNAEPVLIENAYADRRFLQDFDDRLSFQTRSMVAVPLVARGRAFGVIEVLNKKSGEPFLEDDEALLSILAILAASALDYAATTPLESSEEPPAATG